MPLSMQLCLLVVSANKLFQWKCNTNCGGVVDACCLSRCICCFQCRLCLLAEQSIVNGSCRNRGNKNCVC